MERVDHVEVLEVGRRSLVGDVDRVLERQVPDREGLELRVSGLAASLVFMVDLRERCRELARASARSGNDDQRFRYLDVRVGTVSCFGNDRVHVCRVALCEHVLVGADAASFELGHELVHGRSVFISRDDNGVDREVVAPELVYQSHDFQVVCYAEVLPALALDDISCIDADDYLRLIAHPLQEFDLGVFVKSRKHSHGVLVLNQLAAEFQVEPAFAASDPLKDVF